MGCLLSCLKGASSSLASQDENGIELRRDAPPFSLSQETKGSGVVVRGDVVSGVGTALSADSLEQDCCYWEAHVVGVPDETAGMDEIACGVMRRKGPKVLNKALVGREVDEASGLWMKSTLVSEGDVVGLALDMSGIPMLQCYVNGIARTDMEVKRNIRGSFYAAVSINEGTVVKLAFKKEAWKHEPPSSRFEQCVAATSLI